MGGRMGVQKGRVSIQLVSPASGDRRLGRRVGVPKRVSIQLVSPASGDLKYLPCLGTLNPSFPFN